MSDTNMPAEPMADPKQVKLLKIKTNILKRNMADFSSYQAEEATLKQQLQAMVEQGAEPFRVRYQEQLVQETTDTLDTCMPRVEQALIDLQNVLGTFEEKQGQMMDLLKLTSEWEAAQNQVEKAESFVEQA